MIAFNTNEDAASCSLPSGQSDEHILLGLSLLC